MRNKKKMIAIVGAAFALIAAAAVTVSLVHRNSGASVTLEAKKVDNNLGIHYGGEFDESADIYEPDGESDIEDEAESVESIEDIEAIEKEIPRIREEHVKRRSQDNNRQLVNMNSEGTAESESSGIESDEELNLNEMDIPVYQSKGYSENEVICDAQSMEEAEDIASQISGTVLSWDNGVATIQISGSVDELLEKLEQQGSSLELHRKYYF